MRKGILIVLGVVVACTAVQADQVVLKATSLVNWLDFPASWGTWKTDAAEQLCSGNREYCFFKFDAFDFSLIGTIDSAILTVGGRSGNGGDGDLTLTGEDADVYAVTTDYALDGSDKPSAPTIGSKLFDVVGLAGQQIAQVDITSLIQDWKDNNIGYYGICVNDADGYWAEGFWYVNKANTQIEINYQPVPEPGTLLLIGTGVLGAIGCVRRRRAK